MNNSKYPKDSVGWWFDQLPDEVKEKAFALSKKGGNKPFQLDESGTVSNMAEAIIYGLDWTKAGDEGWKYWYEKYHNLRIAELAPKKN